MMLRLLLAAWLLGTSALAGEARIVKVLQHLLDAKGRNALTPSLFERDVYQKYLREHPAEFTALRFDVQIKAKKIEGPLTLRLEVRSSQTDFGKVRLFETQVKPSRWFSTWAKINIDRETTQAMGSIIAWRATLWQDGHQIAEQDSFLW